MTLELVHQRIALRRVKDGGVVKLNWRYLDHGRPVPEYLPYALNCLTNQGIIALADPDPDVAGSQRLSLTHKGLALHAEVCGPSAPPHIPPRGEEHDPAARRQDPAPGDVRPDLLPRMPEVF